MSNNIYLSLTGENQGLISSDCSSYDSIGNAYQATHRDQILIYELAYAISRDQNVNHQPLTFKKPIDKSSPLSRVVELAIQAIELAAEVDQLGRLTKDQILARLATMVGLSPAFG